jgi:hypothetical protein
MTPKRLWTPLALSACMAMTASCAASRPPSPVAPPRLILPEAAAEPCALTLLPQGATVGDLEAAFARRGGQIVACDAARRLAVETLEAERALIDAWGSGRNGRARQIIPSYSAKNADP